MEALASAQDLPPLIRVADGGEALDYLLCRGRFASRAPVHPACILLDLSLPGMDGIDLLKQIRFTPRLSGIPVIVLTGSDQVADVTRTAFLGIECYLQKPASRENIVRVVSKAVAQSGQFKIHARTS